ncbi:MAG: DUF4097 family beta strand repeat protein [Candidatus Eisenbacteria bacterium]|nr:DUF4097 family beta strand repeat protein [Candidatus Eisenbacteria bacterium]
MRMLSCAVAVAALLLSTGASARLIDKDFHRTFDVAQGVRLELRHGDGDVTVNPWDSDVIDVAVRYHADVKALGIGVQPDFDVEFRQEGDVVTVTGIEGSATGLYLLTAVSDYEYTYDIHAPSYVIIESHGDDGDFSLTGWRADIECHIDDGDVELKDIANKRTEITVEDGDVRIDGMSSDFSVRGDDGTITVLRSKVENGSFVLEDGDVRVIDSEGDFDVSVDDGDVRFSRVGAKVVDVRGQDGDIDLDLTGQGKVEVSVMADDGDVMIRLSKGFSFEYLVTMDDGDVTVDFDGETVTERGDHRVAGKVGDGAGSVRVRVSDGDVILARGD